AGDRMSSTAARSGSQPGDPVRAAEAMIHLTEIDEPPRHLVLGAFGFDAVTTRLRKSLTEIEAWKDTTLSADFPPE
ncbi:MAG: short-chain dehydrogenase/reductase, partial [Janthinobacterium lividum]